MVWCTVNDDENLEETETSPSSKQNAAGAADNRLDHACRLDIHSAPSTVRLTGIIGIIGPSSREPEILEKMMEAGMNIACINCSDDFPHEYHAETIKNIHIAVDSYSKKLGTTYPLAIALDTCGAEIHLGILEGGEIEVKQGTSIKFTTDITYFDKGNINLVYVDYDQMHKVVQPGDKIFIDDGYVCLICTHCQPFLLSFLVEKGGKIYTRSRVRLPGISTTLPSVTEKDKADLLFGVEQLVNIIFCSFTRDILVLAEIRSILGIAGKKIRLIAKIENKTGIANLTEIINLSDGIMIARGDLGLEIPIEKLFLVQKSIIARCNKLGKPVICATQLLSSMVNKPRPTRAESADVANLVLDGIDCLMLSAETSKGEYPVQSIQTMAAICKEAESAVRYKQVFTDLVSKLTLPLDTTHTVAIAAVRASAKCLAAAIIVLTTRGRTAFLISRYKPACPILAVTRNHLVAKQSHLYRGVLPLYDQTETSNDWTTDVTGQIMFGISFGKWRKFVREGNAVVLVHRTNQASEFSDTMRVIYVPKIDASVQELL